VGIDSSLGNNAHPISQTIPYNKDIRELEVNRSGETYGSIAGRGTPDSWPDLILVENDDGITGYVRSEDFASASGWGAVSKPEEAIAFMNQRSPHGSAPSLTMYAQDGVTVVGEWSGLNWADS